MKNMTVAFILPRADRLTMVSQLLQRVSLLEMVPEILARALEPFPVAVRTLDALHLASVAFLVELGVDLAVATYDGRMEEALTQMGIGLWEG